MVGLHVDHCFILVFYSLNICLFQQLPPLNFYKIYSLLETLANPQVRVMDGIGFVHKFKFQRYAYRILFALFVNQETQVIIHDKYKGR